MTQEKRDEVVEYVKSWSNKTGVSLKRMCAMIGMSESKLYDWINRHGQANRHNGKQPRGHWLHSWEREAIVRYYLSNPEEGYRRLTFMMIDENVVAASPSSVYRVLKSEGLIRPFDGKASLKGTGFVGPKSPHQHWHVDISYLNVCGTFYYLCSVLDGFSRYIVHWEIRETMKTEEVEIVIQRGKECYPEVRPRIISDNGPQFIARDFKEYLREVGMTHVRTSPYYPQSNGKIERWHKTLKKECIRPKSPLSIDDARRTVGQFVKHYNEVRLHSSIGYITPRDKLMGKAEEIFKQRKEKLEAARINRRSNPVVTRGAEGPETNLSRDVSPHDSVLVGAVMQQQ